MAFGDFGRLTLRVDDVLALPPTIRCGIEPRVRMVTTTIFIDRDYLVDQVFWRQSCEFRDRLEASHRFDAWYSHAALHFHLGKPHANALTPWIDELSAPSSPAMDVDRYYRKQALLSCVMDVLLPYLQDARAKGSANLGSSTSVTRNTRKFAPVRMEASTVAELLRDSPEHAWSLTELTQVVHLSRSQLTRVFIAAFGKTPLAYLTELRIGRMATYLRETDLSIGESARQAGWKDPDYASRIFRLHLGMTPTQYRNTSTALPKEPWP